MSLYSEFYYFHWFIMDLFDDLDDFLSCEYIEIDK